MRALVYGDRVGATGGSHTYLRRLLAGHRANGIDTSVFLPVSALDEALRRWCTESKVDLHMAPSRPRAFQRRWRALLWDYALLRAWVRSTRPQVLIVSNQAPGGGFAAFLQGLPLIFVMHTYPQRPPRSAWIPARFAGPARRLLTVSEFAKRQIEEHMSVAGRYIEVIHNSFDPGARSSARHPDGNLVLTIGHVVSYKNPDLWLDVADEVIRRRPKTRFLWLGDGEVEKMRAQVEKRRLDGSVRFHGHSSRLSEFYSQASVYFQPSRLESHGMAVVDAMAHELPCVVSDVGGLPESVVEGQSGFLCGVDDRGAFADRILRCLEDPQLARELGRCGGRRAECEFSPVAQGQRYLALLAEVTAASSGGQS